MSRRGPASAELESSRPEDGRRLLGSLLERDDLDDASGFPSPGSVRDLSGFPVFSELVRLLAHVRMSEGEAEELWPMLLAHRAEMADAAGARSRPAHRRASTGS